MGQTAMSEKQKRLHYWPDTASLAPHMCLIEAGASFELVKTDLKAYKFLTAEYRTLNPHMRIPTYTEGNPDEGGLVLYEAAAICLHVADTHSNSSLMPELGSDARALAYKYMIYLTNTLQAELMVFNYAKRHCDDESAIPSIRAAGDQRIGKMLEFLDRELGDGRTWLVPGAAHGAVDYYLLMLAGWAEYFKVSTLPSTLSVLGPYLKRCQDLPAARTAIEAEGFEPNF